jgi:hypothetical protein
MARGVELPTLDVHTVAAWLVCRGVEFVLKTNDGKWRSWKTGHGQSSNFYAELPLPLMQ